MKERNEIRFVQAGLDQLTAIYRAFGRKRMGKRLAAGALSLSMVLSNVGINARATVSDAFLQVSDYETVSNDDQEILGGIETDVTVDSSDGVTVFEDSSYSEITVLQDDIQTIAASESHDPHHPTHTPDCGYALSAPLASMEADPGSADALEPSYDGAVILPSEEENGGQSEEIADANETEATVEGETAAEETETAAAEETEATAAEETEAAAAEETEATAAEETETTAAEETETTAAEEMETTAVEETEAVATDESEAQESSIRINITVTDEPAAQESAETAEQENSEITEIPEEVVAMSGWEEPGIVDEYYGLKPGERPEEPTEKPENTDDIQKSTDNNATKPEEDTYDEIGSQDNSGMPDLQQAGSSEMNDGLQNDGLPTGAVCGFKCPICQPELFPEMKDEFDLTLPYALTDGTIRIGETLDLLKDVKVVFTGEGEIKDLINYSVEVYTVATETKSEPDAWDHANTITAKANENYIVVYVIKDADDNIVKAMEVRLETIDPDKLINQDSGESLGEITLSTQFAPSKSEEENGDEKEAYVYAGNSYPVSLYASADPARVCYDDQVYEIKIRVISVKDVNGTEIEDFVKTETGEDTLFPTNDHIQNMPYAIIFEPYIELSSGKKVRLNGAYTLEGLKILSQEELRDELDTDSAFISDSGMGDSCADVGWNGISDGTAPFDEEYGAGNDGPNDKTHDASRNGVVRTFDTITYKTVYKTQMYENVYDKGYKKGRVYFEYFFPGVDDTELEFVVDSMPWLTDKEEASARYEIEYFDGKEENKGKPKGAVLRGSFVVQNDNKNAVGSTEYSRTIVVRVLGMKNGTDIVPKFTHWLAYNDVGIDINYDASYEDVDKGEGGSIPSGAGLVCAQEEQHLCAKHESCEYKTQEAQPVTVSAAPAFNIAILKGNGNNQVEGTFDLSQYAYRSFKTEYSGSNVRGRLNGYGITIQLRNSSTGKGLKGIELPKDNETISFDIKLFSSYEGVPGKEGEEKKADSTANTEYKYKPIVWYADANKTTSKGTYAGTLPTNIGTNYASSAPFNTGDDMSCSCYNGGTWNFEQDSEDELMYHVTVSGIRIDLTKLPRTYSTNDATSKPYYDPDVITTNTDGTLVNYWDVPIASIAGGQIWVLQPLESPEGTQLAVDIEQDASTTTKVSHDPKSVSAMLLSDTTYKTYSDTNTADDEHTLTLTLEQPGSIDSFIVYATGNGKVPLTDGQWQMNGDYTTVGSEVVIYHLYNFLINAEGMNKGAATDVMIKWDDRFFEPTRSTNDNDGSEYGSNREHISFLWGTYKANMNEPSKGGWHKEAEGELLNPGDEGYDDAMRTAMPEDIYWFTSLEDLKNQGYTCCAYMVEYRGLRTRTFTFDNKVYGTVKKSAYPGGVYMVCDTVLAWNKAGVEPKAREYWKKKLEIADTTPLTDAQYNEYLWSDDFHTWTDANGIRGNSLSDNNTEKKNFYFNLPKIKWMSAQGKRGDIIKVNDSAGNMIENYEVYKKPIAYDSYMLDTTVSGHLNDQVRLFVKASYDGDGNYSPGKQSYYGGDSCLVLSHNDEVTITRSPGGDFAVDNGKRFVDVTVSPNFVLGQIIGEGNHDTNAGMTLYDATLTVTLPKKIHYILNSGYIGGRYTTSTGKMQGTVVDWDYSVADQKSDGVWKWTSSDGKYTWSVTENSDGTTTIVYKANKVQLDNQGKLIEGQFPPIHFSCQIGNTVLLDEDVEDGENFTLKAMITDREVPSLQNGKNTSETGFKVFKDLGNGIFKEPDQMAVEAKSPMTFTLSAQNTSQSSKLENKLILDELPLEGTGKEGSYHGDVRVTEFWAGSVTGKQDLARNFKYYYTLNKDFEGVHTSDLPSKEDSDTTEGQKDYNPGEHSESWIPLELDTSKSKTKIDKVTGTEYTLYQVKFENDTPPDKHIVALAAYGDIDPNLTLVMEVSVLAKDAEPGDTVVNGMSMDSQSAKMASGRSYVAKREISGLTWIDSNHNGIQDSGEKPLSGVKVILTKKTSATTKTVANESNRWTAYSGGNAVDTSGIFGVSEQMADGEYKFVNVSPGDYKITFESAEGVDLSSYIATKTTGSSNVTNSDGQAVFDDNGDLLMTEINNMQSMPEADKMGGQVYRIEHQDSGFHRVNLVIQKKVEGDTDKAREAAENTTYKFYVDGVSGSYDSLDVNGRRREISLPGYVYIKGEGQYTIYDLPLDAIVDVKEIKENAKITGYEHSISSAGTDGADKKNDYEFTINMACVPRDDYVVTVNYTNSYRELVDVVVKKVWEDENDLYNLRPDGIEVELEAKVEDNSVAVKDQNGSVVVKQRLNAAGDWTHTWENLYRTDTRTKKEIDYSVKETDTENYPNYEPSTELKKTKNPWNIKDVFTFTATNTLPFGKIRIAKWIDNWNEKNIAVNDLLEDEFIVKVRVPVGSAADDAFKTEMVLQHAGIGADWSVSASMQPGMISGYLKVPVLKDGTVVELSEVIPMEYDPGEVYLTKTKTMTPGTKESALTGTNITLKKEDLEGETVIVIHNKFDHEDYFHDDSSVMNVFNGQECRDDGFNPDEHEPVPLASRPPEAIMEDRKVRTVELDADERLI